MTNEFGKHHFLDRRSVTESDTLRSVIGAECVIFYK